MKFYALVGSPRKKWNDDQLIDRFIDGIHDLLPDAETEKVYVYDLDFKGCRSCFGCKLKKNETGDCIIKDGIHDLLIDIRNSDGFVMASPIYFMDISGEMRSFLERLMYPGPTKKELVISTIYTMNMTEEIFKEKMAPVIGFINAYFNANFHAGEVDTITAFDTLQRKNNDLYVPGHTDHEAKAARHEVQFPIDLQNAFDAGVRFANKAKNKQDEHS